MLACALHTDAYVALRMLSDACVCCVKIGSILFPCVRCVSPMFGLRCVRCICMRCVSTQGLALCCVACVYVIRCVELETSLNKQNEAVSSFIIATVSRYRDKASSHCHEAGVISMQTSHGCQRACVKACRSCASSTLSYATSQMLRQRCRHAGVFYPTATCGVVTLSPPAFAHENDDFKSAS